MAVSTSQSKGAEYLAHPTPRMPVPAPVRSKFSSTLTSYIDSTASEAASTLPSRYSVDELFPIPQSKNTSSTSTNPTARWIPPMSRRRGPPPYHVHPLPSPVKGSVPHSQSIPYLREALHNLESKMATLMTERGVIESQLEQAVRLQSPVQRLPSELLASIFIIGVLQTDDADSLMLSTLMLVCRYWTEVAMGTPILWSRIAVGNHDSLGRARRKLARSKSVPLEICINFSPRLEQRSSSGSHTNSNHGSGSGSGTTTTTTTTEAVIHAMDLLRPSIWRWKSFRLTVPNRAQAHAALTRCREHAPLLEELSVRIFHSMQDDHHVTAPPLPLFEAHIPRLQVCSFTSFNFGWDLSVVSRLRVLKLGGYWNGYSPSVSAILGILRACPELEELALRNMSDVDLESCVDLNEDELDRAVFSGKFIPRGQVNPKAIELPRLKRASFYYTGLIRTRMILSQLSFPTLERVEFCYLDNLTPLLKHLKRQSLTSLPLRSLRIESSFFDELKLVRLLASLPSLETLELIDVEDASSNLLKGLSTPPMAQSWICPNLESLNLDGCTTLEWDALRTFVESRLPAHSLAYPRLPLLPSPSPSTPPTYGQSEFRARAASAPPANAYSHGPLFPRRLRALDLTRCHQIGREMVQWLRMYVADVRCESPKGVWGESPIC